MKSTMSIKRLPVFLLVMGLLWAYTSVAEGQTSLAKATDQGPAAVSMTEKWGIKVVAIHTAAGGNMVDFRYRVVDAKKAEVLFSKKTRPYLIHHKTGKVLAVPRTAKVGPLMSSYRPKQGRIYWMFFGNQPKLVQTGDKVSVVIGDFRAENVTVN